jgi:hypothetical protein
MARAQDPLQAGEFLAFGRMERPLHVDFAEPRVQLLRNPAHASRKSDPRDEGSTYPSYATAFLPHQPFQAGWPWASADFPVVQVLHSVWRSPAGRLGIVFANWSGVAAAWVGTLDPVLYGWPANQRLRLSRIEPDGSEVVLGGLRKKTALRIGEPRTGRSGRRGRELWIGRLAPREILVVACDPVATRG